MPSQIGYSQVRKIQTKRKWGCICRSLPDSEVNQLRQEHWPVINAMSNKWSGHGYQKVARSAPPLSDYPTSQELGDRAWGKCTAMGSAILRTRARDFEQEFLYCVARLDWYCARAE